MTKRKGYLLAAAALLCLSGTSLLTSCQKDYDGQLEILRNQINNGEVNLNGLKEKVTLIEQQIKALEEALAEGGSGHKEDIDRLKTELETVKTDLNNRIAELQAVIDGNTEEIQQLKENIQIANQEFNTRLLEISNQINAIDTSLNVLDGRVAKLEMQVEALQEKQKAVELAIEGLKTEMAGLGSDMADQKQKMEEALTQLQEVKNKLTTDINQLKALVDEVKKATATNAANLESLRQNTIEKITAVKTEVDARIQNVENEMAGLSSTVQSLGNKVNQLNSKYDNLGEQLNNLVEKYDLQIYKIWEAINALTPGSDTELNDLKELVTTLQKDLDDLKTAMNKQLKELLNTQKLFGNDLQQTKELVENHTQKLNELSTRLDQLGLKVSTLEGLIQDMQTAYQLTLTDIEKRLSALEQQGGGSDPAELAQLKQDLLALQQTVDQQTQDILNLKGDQRKQAEALTQLNNYVQSSILALQTNYNNLNKEVSGLKNFVETLNDNLKKTNQQVGELTSKVNLQASQIMDLYSQIKDLQEGQSNYVTREEIEMLLDNYYDKAAIDRQLEAMFQKINDCPTLDDMNQAIEEAAQQLQEQLDKMQQQIAQLTSQYDALKQQVETLMNRIQSFELLADYNDGTVKVKETTPGHYTMELKVEITPEDAAGKLTNLKGIVGLRCREVIPVRSSNSLPAMTVEEVTQSAYGELTVKVGFTLEEALEGGQALPYQVAVVLNDGNNYKLTEYRPLRLESHEAMDTNTDYTFMAGTEILQTKEDIGVGNFAESEIYKLPVLKAILNQSGASICQIEGIQSLFNAAVTASSTVEGSSRKDLPVVYSLAAIYDTQGVARGELWNYIEVSTAGQVSMKSNLTPGVTPTSLEGFKMVVGLQAKQNGQNYGKRAYVCFRLQMKNDGLN